MAKLRHLDIDCADNGYIVNVSHEGKKGESSERIKKVASSPGEALRLIGHALGSGGDKKRRKGAMVMMSDGEPPTKREGKKKGRRKVSYKRA